MSIDYYRQFGRIVLYDNFSDDNTREIALEHGVGIQLFGTKGELNDQHYLDVKNNCWKGSQADWVIIVDDDEILWHDKKDLISALEVLKNHNYTIIQPQGYSIYSDSMPQESWLEIKTGVKDSKYSKLCCFNPKEIKEIRYVYGCHEANPIGNIKTMNDLFLLHYHGIGGVERMIERHKLYEERRQRSTVNMRWGLGKEYGYSPESKRKWFKEQLEKSTTLFAHGTM
jgi:hypothetical protein